VFGFPETYTFHDFLVEYLIEVLGVEWAIAEAEKLPKDRHPLMWWPECIYAKRINVSAPPGLIIDQGDPPEAHAYLSAAYDVYTSAHNTPLQDYFLKRLKNPDLFHGAHYELQVIAAFFRAGFNVDFENERDSTTSHHEFTATYKLTGQAYSVECKARYFDFRSYPTWEEALPHAERVNVTRHIQRALAKKAAHPRIIFVDVSYPHVEQKEPAWIKSVLSNLRGIEERERPTDPYPSALIFFTNNDSRSFSSFDSQLTRFSILRPFKLPAWKLDWHGEMGRNPGIHALMRSLDIHKRIPHEFYRLGLKGEVLEDRKGKR